MAHPSSGQVFFGATTFRRQDRCFAIKAADRLTHLYAIGKTGVGKSTLLTSIALQDLHAGRGFAVVDPHGEVAVSLRAAVPASRRTDIVYLDAAAPDQPYGYNPLRRVREDLIPLAVGGVLETFKKLWPDAWGVRMEHVLRASLYALIERDGSTLPDILALYSDKDYRAAIVKEIRNPVVKAFWEDEFEPYPARYRVEAVAPVQNKLGALLSDPRLYRLLVEPQIDLRFRAIMDERRGLIVNLDKGRLGEDGARIVGGLIVSTIGLAAFSRSGLPQLARQPFYLHVDEFQNFTTLAFAGMMSELRKYGVGLTLAHQHLFQLEPAIRHAVLGNAGTLIAFRLGPEDAQLFAAEMAPKFGVLDLINLPNHHAYLKLMIDGAPSPPFSARILTPAEALACVALQHYGLS